MKRAATILVLVFFAFPARADVIQMRSGEKRAGKVLAETDSQVLFRRDPDGVVVEVPRSDIAIIDMDPSSQPLKGSVGFFTQAPKRKTEKNSERKRPFDFLKSDEKAKSDAGPTAAPGGGALQKHLAEWVKDRPEMAKMLKDYEDQVAATQKQADDMAKVVQESQPS